MNGIGLISSWIKDIVVLFTLISIAELVMPKGNMKKYIELVIGILIMFTIISPFASMMNYDFKLDDSLYNYTKRQEREIKNEDDFYMSQEDQIKSLVIEKMKGEIIHITKANTDYEIVDIDIALELYSDSEEINYIKLVLGREKKDTDSDISIEKITPVKINGSQKDKDLEEQESLNLGNDELKKIIADEFSIDSKKIIIEEIEE